MSDVSMMGTRVSASAWQRQSDMPIVGGMVGRLLDFATSNWTSKFASERPLALGTSMRAATQSDQGSVLGVGAASRSDRGFESIAVGTAEWASSSLSRRHQALTDPRLQNVARPVTSEEKQALDEYVSQGKWPEQRAQAVERITRFIESSASVLMLDNLGLTQLPDIVKTLRLDSLDISGNKLAEVPLPAKVAFLHVSRNALTAMPVLPEGTRVVFAADNRIREFRGPLPDTLSHVYAPNNMLDAVPPFPASIARFDIAGNTGKLAQADVDAKICRPFDGGASNVSGPMLAV